MSDKEFDTSELLSSLEKLKAKYSFSLDEDGTEITQKQEVTILEKEEALKEADEVLIDEVEKADEIVKETAVEPEIEKEPEVIYSSSSSDMSWLIDNDDKKDEPAPQIIEPEIEPEEIKEDTPVAKLEEKEVDTSWFLSPPDTQENEEEKAQDEQEEPQIEATPIKTELNDEFDDLDSEDDLKVIRAVEDDSKNSPFYAAFMQTTTEEAVKQKPPKPVKSQKPAKPVKEPKEKKEKKAKSSGKKVSKRVVLNIVVAAVLVIAVWACAFVTDIALLSKWEAPIFCVESESYDDGSKTYIGAFYQIQLSRNEDGSFSREFFPWFVQGSNANK